jgi:hypothetical protein
MSRLKRIDERKCSMLAQDNKAVVRRLWEEVWNENRPAVCDEIFDAAYAAMNRDG